MTRAALAEHKNHKMVWIGRDIERSSRPTPNGHVTAVFQPVQ